MSTTNDIYNHRINKVIDYINANLHKSLSLDELASKAHFSSFHFHRIFVAIVGESVNFYTNRIRLEKAARLLKLSRSTITDISMECGFSSPATFSRSFKQYFNLSPSRFRSEGDIKNSKNCKEHFPMDEYLVPMSLKEKQKAFPVKVTNSPQRRVAYIRVVDSYREGVVVEAFTKLIAWAKKNEIYEKGQFFGMSLDDPLVTPQQKYRYEACVTVPKGADLEAVKGIQFIDMPKCKYASTIVSGDIFRVATAIDYLFNTWLLSSDYEPEHLHGIEKFLDKKNICNWEHFDLELSIPIKKLKTI